MRARTVLSIVMVPTLLSLMACEDDQPLASVETFKAALSGLEEVPAVVTTATGAATFQIQEGLLFYDVNLGNAPAVTAAHIHLGGRGTIGGVIVTLGGPLAATVTANGTVYTGVLSNAQLSGITVDSLASLFRSGGAYVNVHNVANPGGLIRGQVVPN